MGCFLAFSVPSLSNSRYLLYSLSLFLLVLEIIHLLFLFLLLGPFYFRDIETEPQIGCLFKIPFLLLRTCDFFQIQSFLCDSVFSCAALFSSPILIHRPLQVCIYSHGLPSNPLFLFSSLKFAGITKSTSNEGMHSGTGSAFSSRLDEVSPNGQILPITPTLKIFSFAELKKATRNFRPDTVVGEGGFGRVFKGWIDEKAFAPTKAGSGMPIAVKKLNSDDFQGRKEWLSEVNILGSLSHPNIVRLLGHSETDRELLLVYEFMPRGSLGNHLFSRGSPLLPWSIWLKIAIGVARGLAFLHCSERKIIHRNLTPYNVLIDSNYNTKISDFGLARNGPQGENSHVSTDVMGTYGYVAPEYVATGHKALDPNRPSGQHDLVVWAKPYLSDERKVSLLMDRRLEGQYPTESAVLAAQLILACLNSDRRKRLSMTEVLEALEQIQAIKHKAYSPRTKD